MIPYVQIVAAEISPSDDVPAIRVRTRGGRQYQWFPNWMQGSFNPEEVLARIRAAAKLPAHNNEPQSANDERPTTNDQ